MENKNNSIVKACYRNSKTGKFYTFDRSEDESSNCVFYPVYVKDEKILDKHKAVDKKGNEYYILDLVDHVSRIGICYFTLKEEA